MSARVAGKIALVTGAGTGIGRAACIRLAEEGAEVVVTSRTPAHVEETCAEVELACGRTPLGLTLDLADRHAVDAAVAEIVDRYRRIDVVSNNAGIELVHGPTVEQTTDEEWELVFRVNVTGTFWVCRAALPHMGEGASIVNTASINSFVAWPNDSSYTMSKGALLQFTRALALDVAERGIRANCAALA